MGLKYGKAAYVAVFSLVFRGSRGRGKMPFKLVHDEKSTKVCQG